MKKLSLFLMTIIVSCSLFADTDNYTITWDLPTETGIVMELYLWQGLDSLACPFFPGYPLNTTSPYYRYDIDPSSGIKTDFLAVADGKTYFSVMGQYKKISNGLTSTSSWATVGNTTSHFRLSNDLSPPTENVENMKIQE